MTPSRALLSWLVLLAIGFTNGLLRQPATRGSCLTAPRTRSPAPRRSPRSASASGCSRAPGRSPTPREGDRQNRL